MTDSAPSIETLGAPLAFRAILPGRAPEAESLRGESACLVLTRSLAGMQKEALVRSTTGALWRMTCDEGPYLNGADVAPFPLAFVSAGLAISIATSLRRLADADGAELGGLTLTLDNFYTMEGSALRGTMTGGALTPEISATTTAALSPDAVDALLVRAIRDSAAAAFFRDSLANEFSMHLNGELSPLRDVRSTTSEIPEPPGDIFDRVKEAAGQAAAPEILSKLKAAEPLFGVDGGAGSSLAPEQKRNLHVRAILTLSPSGLYEVKIQLFKPIGSVFSFVGDDPLEARAPSGVDYLSAGVAFCFMTQLGRYAQIVKQKLLSYEIVQETRFWPAGAAGGDAAKALPIVTHVYLESEEDLEANQQLVKMGEQTCFAHAAMSAGVEPGLAARK